MKEDTTKEKGFTLLEILISMVILAVGLLALSSMQGTFATGNAQSRRLTHAINLASSKLDELKNISYDSSMLEDSSNRSLNATDPAEHSSSVSMENFDYTVNWNINATDNFKQIRVIVTWNQEDKDIALDWIKPRDL